MNRTSFRKNNQHNLSSLCFDIYSAKEVISKKVLLITTLILVTLAQQAFPDDGSVVEAGDIPFRVPRI